jgi:hypothetical protein
MTTHDQQHETTEFTTAPADFVDGQEGDLPQAAAAPAEFDERQTPSHAAPATDAPRQPVEESAQAAAQSTTAGSGSPVAARDTSAAAPADALFAQDDLSDLRSRWNEVQATFVDDPKDCVTKADGLVSDAVDQLTAGFSHARSRLEEQWAKGEEASTEDLRIALKRYREFFDRLLAV